MATARNKTTFEGYDLLKSYILESRRPSMKEFVASRLDDVAKWSMTLGASSAADLFNTWSQRFTRAQQEWKPHSKVKPPSMDEQIWDHIAAMRQQRLNARFTYSAESLRAMNAYGKKAADTIIEDISSSSVDQQQPQQQQHQEAGPSKLTDDSSNASSSSDMAAPLPEEQAKPQDEILFSMGYKKFKGIPWDTMEESLMKSGLETKNSKKFADNLDVVVAKILQKQGPLDELDLSLLKLSLSHIVNLLRTDLVGRLEEYLPMRLPIHGLVGPCNDFNSRGLSGESSGLFDKIAAEVMSDASVEEVLATVLDLKRAHIGKGRHSQEYRLLSILEYVIESADDWQPDDSEMTVYRRVATVMDYLFRSTDVKLMDGESASQCTKSARQYMENVFGGSIPDTAHGRKIDLILKRANNGGDIELSSNEFKRQRVSSTCALAQQCKNLRTNGAILAHLEAIDNQHRHRHVVAMDWIGNVGYLYMLANVEGVYVADKLCILRLPRCLNDVATFKPTLEALFRYQCFITQLGHQSLSMLQAREDLESLSGIVDTGSEAIPAPAKHRIFFAPQNHRIKRPKVNQP